MRTPTRLLLATALAVAISLVSKHAPAQETYWIGEHTDYTGNGCPNNFDLNDVTSSLKAYMDADGWTGNRYVNASSWPRDYWEASTVPNGIDNIAADARGVAVFAGHGSGSGNSISFGTPNLGACFTTLSSQTWLGTQSGDTAYAMMYLTSCTLNITANPTANFTFTFNNETRQEFGYHNSPTIQDGSAGQFFGCTGVNSNVQCWLTYMEPQFEFWFGWNSPVVVSHGFDYANCDWTRTNCKLQGGVCTSSTWEPWNTWCLSYIDNGGGPCT
jgi:hypothetical protein